MAIITPFRGLRYNQKKIDDLALVVTPPYDLIDETAQAKYYAQDPTNIIRLEHGLTFHKDTSGNNRYTRAGQYLKKWIEDETLNQENKPSVYFCQQEFDSPEGKFFRNALLCGLMLEPYESGNILPHVKTLSRPKADRLSLIRATCCNFSPLFGLFADKEKYLESTLYQNIKTKSPDIDIIDEDNVTHRIWVINDEAIINHVASFMYQKNIYIADGHHRYEAALDYYQEMKEQGYDSYNYVMAALVNVYDEGLIIQAAHRLAGNLPNFRYDIFIEQLSEQFNVKIMDNKNDLEGFIEQLSKQSNGKHVFGMYAANKLHILELKDIKKSLHLLPADKSDSWKIMDTNILDTLILEQLLGLGEPERRNQDNLAYTPNPKRVIEQVDRKQFQLGFMLNPPAVNELVSIARTKDVIPQKSAYFYPRLLTGLIINNLSMK